MVEPIDGAAEQVGGDRHVVALQCSPACRRQTLCGALAEPLGARIQRADLPKELVCLLQMPADGLIVLGTSAGGLRSAGGLLSLRFDPVGQPLVQLGARPLEQSAVRRVADQHMVEAQHRLAEQPAGVGLDQLGAPQRLEARVERAAVASEQRRHRAAREMPADHGGPLQYRALLRLEALDACCQQRMNGRRHLQGSQVGAHRPAIPTHLDGPLVHQHAHQLTHEQRIALAGGQHLGCHRRRQVGGADHVGGQAHRRAGIQSAQGHNVGDEAADGGQ